MNINSISRNFYNIQSCNFGMKISDDSSDDFKIFSDTYIKGGYKRVVSLLNKINNTENDTVIFSNLFSRPKGFFYRFNDREPIYLFKVSDELSKIKHNSLKFPVDVIKTSFADYFEKNLKRI